MLLLAAACHASDERMAQPSDAVLSEHTPDWQNTRNLLDSRGAAERTFNLPQGSRAFALRTRAAGTSSVMPCYALEDVTVNGETSWVPRADVSDYGDYCTRCEQRVSVGSDYGLYILPSAPGAALELRSVSARIALRDCATLTPQSTDAFGLAGPLFIEVSHSE